MSPAPLTKRRRLNNASHTLSQPFKSPFKNPFKSTSANEARSPIIPAPQALDKDDNDKNVISSPAKLPKHFANQPRTNIPQTLEHSTTSPQSSSCPNKTLHRTTNPRLSDLQTQHTHLLTNLSTARTNLETSTQALRIESSPRDAELALLITKWRTASREAAEELFRGVRDRVNRMGGVGALREKEREKRERDIEWQREEREAEVERREEERERVKEEIEEGEEEAW
ncbi:MAG: hypothetical protein Q9164_007121, partial [Protoblastenia rupestris]